MFNFGNNTIYSEWNIVPSNIKRSPEFKLNDNKFSKLPFIITNTAPDAPIAKIKKVLYAGNFLIKSALKHNEINGNKVKMVAADVGLVNLKE